MNITCYHHDDIDGFASGYLVANYSSMEKENYRNFKACNYDSEFDKDNTNIVYICDMSFSKETFNKVEEILKTAKRVIWIDHHATSKEFINDNKFMLNRHDNLTYFINTYYCGAVLTWLYFYLSGQNRDLAQALHFNNYIAISKTSDAAPSSSVDVNDFRIRIPMWLSYIDDYDCFKMTSQNTRRFILGMESEGFKRIFTQNRSKGRVPLEINKDWIDLSREEYINQYIKRGEYIESYLDSMYDGEISHGYECEIDGIKAFAINARGNSYVFGNKYYEYPLVVLYHYDGDLNKFNYSLYSDQTKEDRCDCSKLAEKYGGGGHPGASGFGSNKMEFLPIK